MWLVRVCLHAGAPCLRLETALQGAEAGLCLPQPGKAEIQVRRSRLAALRKRQSRQDSPEVWELGPAKGGLGR